MADIQENMAVANEISEAISNPMGTGLEIDDVRPLYMILHVFTHKNHLDFQQAELKAELEELEQEQLDERLIGADHVPLHHPGGTVRERKSSFQYHSSPTPHRTLLTTFCHGQRHARSLRQRTTKSSNSRSYRLHWQCSV